MSLQTRYLDRLNYILGAKQANEVLGKLKIEREQGSISTVSELRERLMELIPGIRDRVLAPLSHEISLEEGQTVSEKQISDALIYIVADLTGIFNENDNLHDMLEAQQALMLRSITQDLRKAVKQLKARLEINELLASFNQGGVQSFSGSRAKVLEGDFRPGSRQNIKTSSLYIDPQTTKSLSPQNECSFTGDNYLQLPVESDVTYSPRSARVIATADNEASEIEVDLPELGPNNAIDGLPNTYWARSVLLTAPRTTDYSDSTKNGITHQLQIDFDNLVSFNYVALEPILSSECYLVKVESLRNSTWTTQWESTSYDGGINLAGKRTLYFTTDQAESIRLTFESRYGRKVMFSQSTPPEGDTLKEYRAEGQSSVSSLLYAEFSQTKAHELLGALEDTLSSKEYYEYFLGIDNIYVGLGHFKETGIFVSKPVEYKNLSSLGISTDWLIPYRNLTSWSATYTDDPKTDIGDGSSKEVLGLVELYLCKWDYAADGRLLAKNVFPVVPLFRQSRVYERLILTDRTGTGIEANNYGFLRFLASNLSSSVKLYKDGDPLTITTDWEEYTTASQTGINNGLPMKQAIRIKDPQRESAYTVVYDVVASNIEGKPQYDGSDWATNSTLLNYYDVLGDMSVTMDELSFYHFDSDVNGVKIAKSDVSVIVVLRNNSKGRFPEITPVLKNYKQVAFEAKEE